MAHIHTIVKVHADTEEIAVREVQRLLTNDGEYTTPPPFDWLDEEATKVSEEVKTETDFEALRETERKEYEYNLKQADEAESESMKGFYLRRAGECLDKDLFWSSEREAYYMDWTEGEGKNIYYVATDRHY
jgi:hypothetical protein